MAEPTCSDDASTERLPGARATWPTLVEAEPERYHGLEHEQPRVSMLAPTRQANGFDRLGEAILSRRPQG